jgi:ribonuclease P protein component
MLPKRLRLKSRWLFQKTLKEGRCLYRSSFFTWIGLNHWKPNPKISGDSLATEASLVYMPRIGFIVSKKVDKRSAVRNRLKRRLRECLRQEILPTLSAEQLNQYATWVLIAKPTATRPSYTALKSALWQGVGYLTPRQKRTIPPPLKQTESMVYVPTTSTETSMP